jgi:hemerythrin-like domain-containing protein
MPIQIGKPAEHGFDEPLGLLADCHRRIERFLNAIIVVTERAHGDPLSPSDRDVLQQCRQYFATSGPRHTADEEESLFPRMRASADADAREALERIQRLESDHRAAEQRHARVDSALDRWLSAGTLSGDETEALLRDLTELQSIYARHIKVEDEEVFPAAAAALTGNDLEAIGREMADRRGVAFRKDW